MKMKQAAMSISRTLAYAMIILSLAASTAAAADYATLTGMFAGYKQSISDFADALCANDWVKGKTVAEDLVVQSKAFKKMADAEYKDDWDWEAQGMVNHSTELVELCDAKASNDAYFVSAALFLHLNHIVASTPLWLKEHVGEMVKQATEGVAQKNKEMAIGAGEEIHLAAHELSVSGQIMERMFANTRWIKDARKMHLLGDEFQGAVNEGNWETAQKQIGEIDTIYKKVASSYK
ncbi:MAG: hypothetical protein C4531_17910 [Desulfurivibrio sp.]|nr:MAG: hypothetical protein C4531_17910 [Desulfurivibrio sp.]